MQESNKFESALQRLLGQSGKDGGTALAKLVQRFGFDMSEIDEEIKKLESMSNPEKAQYLNELKDKLPEAQKPYLEQAIALLRSFFADGGSGGQSPDQP